MGHLIQNDKKKHSSLYSAVKNTICEARAEVNIKESRALN